jgi:phosphoglycerate dehydrogenase-like enzyme
MREGVMNVLLHYAAGPVLRADAAALPLNVTCIAEEDEAGFHAALAEADVIWHCLRPIGAADIARAPKLRLIQKIGVGVNTIDLEAAKARGIAVCNMPGTNAPAVAEMTLGLILACLRRLPALDAATRAGRGWIDGPPMQETFGELGGRTVGFVGYGGIPQALAPALTALGATVIYTATAAKPGVPYPFVALDELLAQADIVSLHIPLTAATKHLLDAKRLARMKPGAILVNTARGGLVDPKALHAALRSGALASAGLDVFETEPVAPDEPLLKLPNVVLAPHLAWLTPETWRRSLTVAAENCRRLAASEELLHRVA